MPAQPYVSRYAPRFRPAAIKPDHSKQLDLFSNVPSDAPHEPPRANDSPSLAAVLPADGGRPSEPAAIAIVAGTDGAADSGSPISTPVLGDAVLHSLGDGDAGMGIPADRGPPIEIDEPEPARTSRDFRLTPENRIGEGSLHEKARNNLATIRTLKQIEAENRDATDDEKAVLAKYAGWDAMPHAFSYGYVPRIGAKRIPK
jgi:hypothetical protein